MASTAEMMHSPLEAWHRARGARMTDFHGWTMPLIYTKVSEEVGATRQRVGLFDLSHMGRIQVRGEDRVAFVDTVFTNHVEAMEEGQVAYGFLCNERGGVIDDITVYRADDYLMLVVNASNREEVLAWLEQHRAGHRVAIEDKTVSLCMLAVQGPEAVRVLAALTRRDPADLGYYHFRLDHLCHRVALVSRTGYTGEDGFEIYFGRAFATEIWEALLAEAAKAGGAPVGLAARDTLRLEAAMPLHGQELTRQITPIEARLEKFVAFQKRDFIGRRHLLDTTNSDVSMRLVCFEMIAERAIPRTGYPLCFGGTECGRVTSGGFSPTLGKAIGMGYVEQSIARVGQSLQVRIRTEHHPAVMVRRPFHRRVKNAS